MRLLGYALVALVCSWSMAVAAPRATGKGKAPAGATPAAPKGAPQAKQVDPKLQAELTRLDQEYYKLIGKQATFAAVKIAKQLYDLQVKATGADSIEAQRRKQTLASAYQQASDYANAEKLYTEILKETEKAKGADSRDTLYALMPFIGIYYAQTRYDELDALNRRILELTKKLDGEQSQAYASQLSAYGALLNVKNEFSAAIRVYEEALKINEAIAKSKDDYSVVSAMTTLAGLYWQTQQQQKAIPLYDKAIQLALNAKDQMFTLRVVTLWSTAMVYSTGGRKDLAAPLFKKAIDMTEAELARLEKSATKQEEWQIQGLVTQLGSMYRFNGDYAKAEETYLRAIKQAEAKGQPSSLEGVVAELKRIQGKNKEAIELYQKAAAGIAKYAPQYINIYDQQIAEIYRELGDYKKAEQVMDGYRAYVVKQYGKKHSMYGYAQLASVNIYAGEGKLEVAEKALDEALDFAEKEMSGVLRTGTDADHAVYFQRYAYVLDTPLNFNLNYAPKSGAAARLALTTVLRRKGRILDAAAAALATIRSKLSPDDKKLLDELNSARAQLAKLTVAGPNATGDANDYAKEVAALEDKIQRLEAQVSKKSAAYRTVTQPIELAAIQKLIPKDARLVELVNYQPYDAKLTYAQMMAMKYKPRRYLAYIAATTGDPVLVDLGEAAPIDAAIESFRKALADPDNDGVADLGKALYDLTMAKIIPKLGGSTNVLLAPDGALNVVPFSALVDDKKDFLIKKYTFTYLTSGRDLLRLSVKTKAQGGGVLFADPTFDSTGTPANGNKTRGARSADLKSLQWPQLPGTAAEADAVTKMFKGLKVYRGDAATEGTLKQVKGPRILHLATHGFFLPDEPPPADSDPSRGVQMAPSMGGVAPVANQNLQYENPLLRSGLAFAGANKLQSGDDDGLLTALEASGLDLWGTKLVVLSACETGIGKVTNGDGVYGLRRSLVIAGAESLVMSMWQVDDYATKELMAGFYKKLSEGKPRSEALRATQLELLAKKKYSHPFYWAAFLPAGATTPIKD